MSRIQLVLLHLSVALTTLTGAVFAYMRYFMKSEDEFALANHPLQPHLLAAHVVVAPVVLFLFGWVFSNHMLPKYRFGEEDGNRKSGIASMILIVPMALSAYLLQIATEESLREAMKIAHWVSSALFVIGYAIHLVKPKATTRNETAG